MNYSKWEKLEQEEAEEERLEKERKRAESKARYEKSEKERKEKWLKKKLKEDPNFDLHEYEHTHGKSRCGCGYADPKELKRLEAERKANAPNELTVEEKNLKKISAVEATREHGAILFKEGKYAHAYAVYERGCLIINGMIDISDETFDQMNKVEGILDVNMAACKLKLKEYQAALDSCRMALNIDEKHVKAHYRMGQAYHAMGKFAQALTRFDSNVDIFTPSHPSLLNVFLYIYII